MNRRVFQLVPVLETGDAIGDHARRIAQILGDRHGGFIVERASPEMDRFSTHWSTAEVKPDDILIYHVALASQVGEWMRAVEARKVIDYHNITPPEYFRVYDPGLSLALRKAREDLLTWRTEAELALADSDFSRRELEGLGFRNTHTLPIIVDFSVYDGKSDSQLDEELSRGKRAGADILFVGRLAPNKRQEDVIKAFAVYKRLYKPSSRLFLVGPSNSNLYFKAIQKFINRLGIEDVVITGRVTHAQLISYYKTADVFLSMSEHEGFGVPWLEAMHFGVPVLSYAATSIPETVGDGGLLFDTKNYEEIAAILDLIMVDDDLRMRLVESGRRRLQDFDKKMAATRLTNLLRTLE